MRSDPGGPEICSRSCPDCYLCGTLGRPLYQGLEDRLFGIPGTWNFKYCPEPGCGLVWLDPMPLEDEIGKAYSNYYTHAQPQKRNSPMQKAFLYAKNGYLVQRFGNPEAISLWQRLAGLLFYFLPPYRERLGLSVMQLRPHAGQRLLDLGCGGGDLMVALQSLGWQVEGVEVDPKAVGVVRAKGLQVWQGTLASLRYPSGYFHAITMHHVIEHLHDLLSLLQECHRILAPGGRLVIITPNISSRLHRKFRRDWRGLEPPRHLLLFSPSCLGALVRHAGFTIDSLTTTSREAPFFYFQSRRIAGRDRLIGSLCDRFWANCLFWLGWAGVRLWPNSGEELILHGKKVM